MTFIDAASPRTSEQDLVTGHLPLVGYVVNEVAGRLPAHVSRDDLTSAGMTALVQAARSFDPDRGVPFSRFAALRIRGALLDELRSLDWASRSVRARARRRDAAHEQLTMALGRTPTTPELADYLGVAAAELDAVEEDTQRAVVLSLQALPAPAMAEELVADRAPGPEEQLLVRERLGFLVSAVSALPERLRFVIERYFFDDQPMAAIAAELGVTESRVSQMRAEALSLLRDGINAQLDPDLVGESSRPGGCVARRREAYYAAVASQVDYRARLSMTAYPAEPRRAERSARTA